jgi:hypothetical protein
MVVVQVWRSIKRFNPTSTVHGPGADCGRASIGTNGSTAAAPAIFKQSRRFIAL